MRKVEITMHFLKIAKLIKHSLILFSYKWTKKDTTLDVLAEAFQGVAARWTGEYEPLYTYLVMFDVLRQKNVTGYGLEIGGGYSTILLAEYGAKKKIRVQSIDVNPDKYLRIIPSRGGRRILFQNVERVDRLSVSFQEVRDAFGNELGKRIQKIGNERFHLNLGGFITEGHSLIKKSLKDSTFLGNYLLSLPAIDEEREFYLRNNLIEGQGYCSRLRDLGRQFDFIFFDCGEYSSLAEWFALEGQIKLGGYAFLHDIYFPKSIKNFIVAAIIASSEEWEVVYIDRYSSQGGLVAKRIKDAVLS
jgi:hypothetical protein